MTKRITEFSESISKNSSIIHTLIIIFGVSAWLGINGIFVQLPLIVSTAPEKWSLPVYLVTIIQSANIGPILYTLLKKFKINEEICICIVLVLGTISMCLLAFFYDITSQIIGNEHSLMLFVFVFFTAIVGCTSSVLFMPYLSSFNAKYLPSYFIGEGLSGVIPSAIALIQGIGNDCSIKPLFSPRIYFIILFIILLLSLISFFLLNLIKNEGNVIRESEKPDLIVIKSKKGQFIYLHMLVCVICCLSNGFLPGIQSYSCMPYGRTAYHLAVTLANIANPLACFLHVWINFNGNLKIINLLIGISLILSGYVTFLAATDEPPLRGDHLGSFFLIISWIIIMGLFSYSKLGITSIAKERNSRNSLFSIGSFMQIGSAIGAIVGFSIINFTGWFQSGDECSL